MSTSSSRRSRKQQRQKGRKRDPDITPLPAPLPGLYVSGPVEVVPPPEPPPPPPLALPEVKTTAARRKGAPPVVFFLGGLIGALSLSLLVGRHSKPQPEVRVVPHPAPQPIRVQQTPAPAPPPVQVAEEPAPAPVEMQPPAPEVKPAAPEPPPAPVRRSMAVASTQRHAAPAKAAPQVAPPAPPPAPVPQLSQDILHKTMVAAEPQLKSCIQEGWGSDVSIGMRVAASGQVQAAEVQGPLGQTATGRCLSARLQKVRFPPFTSAPSKQFFWPYHLPSPEDATLSAPERHHRRDLLSRTSSHRGRSKVSRRGAK